MLQTEIAGNKKLPLLLAIFFIFLLKPNLLEAEGGFLYFRVSADAPITLDLSEIGGDKNIYVFPRDFKFDARRTIYTLEPRRVLFISPGTPTLVLEVFSAKPFSKLKEENLQRVRQANLERNSIQNSVTQLQYEVSQKKLKLRTLLNNFGNGAVGGHTLSAQSENLEFAQPLLEISKLILDIGERKRALTFNIMRQSEQERNYELARLELAILLNLQANTMHQLSDNLISNSPQKVLQDALERAQKEKDELTNDVRRVSLELAKLRGELLYLLSKAVSFGQNVEIESFLVKLAEGKVILTNENLKDMASFLAFFKAYVDYTDKTEEAKVLTARIFELSSLEREIRGKLSKKMNPTLMMPKPTDFKPPMTFSESCKGIYSVSEKWNASDWQNFLVSLSKSVNLGEGILVKFPRYDNSFLNSEGHKLYPLEICAFLSAIEGRLGKPDGDLAETFAFVKNMVLGTRRMGKDEEASFWEFVYFVIKNFAAVGQ